MYYAAREKAMGNGRVYHLAAILRRKGKIVRIGINSSKTHPRFTRTYPDGTIASHMHAEMDALRFSQPGDTLEVMRFKKRDCDFAMAKPYAYCMSHIQDAGIKSVRYTNPAGDWEEMMVGG